MEGATDHGNGAFCGFDRLGDFKAHMGLACRFAPVEGSFVFAQGCHRVGDGGENRPGIGILLDHIAPPAFAIFVSCGAGQSPDRIVLDAMGERGW